MSFAYLLAGTLAFSPADPKPQEWADHVGEKVVVYDASGNHFEGELVAYDEVKDRLVLEDDGDTLLLSGSASSLLPPQTHYSVAEYTGEPPPPPKVSKIDEGLPYPIAEWRKGTRHMAIGGGLLAAGSVAVVGGLGWYVTSTFSFGCIGCIEEQEQAQAEERRQDAVAPTVTMVLGSFTAIAGIALLAEGGSRRYRARRMTLQPYAYRRGGGLTLTGRF